MKIEIELKEDIDERKVIIITDVVDAEIEALMERISVERPRMLAGFSGDSVTLLEPGEIIRIYAAAGKVYAVTLEGEYVLRMRLYELENRLELRAFVRISNSEIVNLKKVRKFDLSYAGTIRVDLTNGDNTFVSRRYMGKIKKALGL